MEAPESFIKECLFPIDVEHLCHVDPERNNDQRSNSNKYLAVLDHNTREMLGVKKYFKSYPIEKCVPHNGEILNDALRIFSNFSENKKVIFYDWKLSEGREQFFVILLGLEASIYLKQVDWENNYRVPTNITKSIFNKFLSIKKESPSNFLTFLEKQCINKRIYFSASNSYDIQLPRPEFNMGLTDLFVEDRSSTTVHLAQFNWSRGGMWFPPSLNFELNIREWIITSFTLSQIELASKNLAAIVLDLENIDIRRRSLERKTESLNKAKMIVNTVNEYISENEKKSFSYFDLLFLTSLIRWHSKESLKELQFREFTHHFSKKPEDERKMKDLLTLASYSDSERFLYEAQRHEEFMLIQDQLN